MLGDVELGVGDPLAFSAEYVHENPLCMNANPLSEQTLSISLP